MRGTLCRVLSGTLLVLSGTVCLLSALILSPHLVALFLEGASDHLPGRVPVWLVWQRGREQFRQLGGTRFADTASYWSPGLASPPHILSENQREAYFTEGYLLLRGLVPPATALALREELLATFGYAPHPFEANPHIYSDAVLDFLVLGPLAGVVAQLLGPSGPKRLCTGGEGDGASDCSVRLVRSVHHFGGPFALPRIRDYHYDFSECSAGFPPARNLSRTLIKFSVALYDGQPAMWFVNQSTMEAYLQNAVGAEGLRALQAGQIPALPHPENLTAWMPKDFLDHVALKPLLALGDAIVHSTALVHRSAPTTGARRSGLLFPTYAPREALLRQSMTDCDLGLLAAPDGFPVRVAGVPQQSTCFPLAHPPGEARGSRGTLRLRISPRVHRWSTWWAAWHTTWRYALLGRGSLQTVVSTDVPESNTVLVEEVEAQP